MARKYSEKWATQNCDTSVPAQEIMSERIRRVSLEINTKWSHREKVRRARYAFSDPYIVPMNVQCGNGFTYSIKGHKLKHGGNQ